MVDYETKKELDALSKEVFGASSRWQKLMNKGYVELATEEVIEYVPAEKEEDPGTERKVQVPVKKNGMYQNVTKYHTVESVKAYMLDRKVHLDKIKEQIMKSQADAKAKKDADELSQKVHKELMGSAL